MFKVAVAGSGYIAQNHFEALRRIEGVEIVAVVGRNPRTCEKAASDYGCTWVRSLREARELGADVADICLPTDLHEPWVIEAAGLGMHVVCEKPVTFTVESFHRMTAACGRAGVRFMVAQVSRWWPEFIAIRRLIEEGRLGALHMISEKRLCRHPTWTTWHRDPKKSGGGVYDLNLHDIDFLVSLFGTPESVYATGWKSPSGCWNHVCTSLNWASGARAVVEASLEMTGGWPFTIGFRATGDAGTLDYAFTAGENINDGASNGRLLFYPEGREEPETVAVEQADMFEGELREFFSAVREGREAAVTWEENRRALRVVEATLRSLRENAVVRLND